MVVFVKPILFLCAYLIANNGFAQKIGIKTLANGLFLPQTTLCMADAKTVVVAASGLRGLSCIDPKSALEIGSYKNKNTFVSVCSVSGTYVCALTDAPALLVFDMKKPSKPSLKKTVKLPVLCTKMAVSGKYLIAYSPGSAFVLLDVSKPTSAKIKKTATQILYRQFIAFGDQFLALKENSLYSFSAVTAEKTTGSFLAELPLGAGELFVHAQALYLTMGKGIPAKLTVLEAKVEITTSDFPAMTKNVFSCLQNDFVLTDSGEIKTRSSGLWKDTGFKTPFLEMNILGTNETCWFYHPGTDLYKISFHEPEKPVQTGQTTRDKTWSAMFTNDAYLISGCAGTISVYDIQKPAKPVLICKTICDEAPLEFFFQDNLLTVFCGKSIRVYTFNEGKTLTLTSALPLETAPLQMLQRKNNFFAACKNKGLLHFGLSPAGVISLKASYAEKKADVKAVVTDGESVIALDSGYGALYYSLNENNDLIFTSKIAVSGGISFAANDENGKIYILRNFAPSAILANGIVYESTFPSQSCPIFLEKYVLYSEGSENKISPISSPFLKSVILPDYQLVANNENNIFLYGKNGLAYVLVK